MHNVLRYPEGSFRQAVAMVYGNEGYGKIDQLPDTWPDTYLKIGAILAAMGIDYNLADGALKIAELAQNVHLREDAVPEQFRKSQNDVDLIIIRSLFEVLAANGLNTPEPTLKALRQQTGDLHRYVTDLVGKLNVDLCMECWNKTDWQQSEYDKEHSAKSYTLDGYLDMLQQTASSTATKRVPLPNVRIGRESGGKI